MKKLLSDLYTRVRYSVKKKVYVVHMLRWGSRENHSYIHSAHDTMNSAYKAAEEEANNRGGKYEYEILELCLNDVISNIKYLKSFVEPCNKGCDESSCSLKDYVCKKR
jgi:hypothetical protein